MKKLLGALLVICGAIIIIISIMGLVKAFDTFNSMGPDFENVGYVFGSILFPLLLTVFGRWVFRKGIAMFRRN
jgi:multisubunit Na+/H+ antiporter MnhG subunit